MCVCFCWPAPRTLVESVLGPSPAESHEKLDSSWGPFENPLGKSYEIIPCLHHRNVIEITGFPAPQGALLPRGITAPCGFLERDAGKKARKLRKMIANVRYDRYVNVLLE